MTTDNKEVTTPTGWKPDFREDNPWEGMPQDYVEQEATGYVPTPELPLPPSQRTPEGIAARELAPQVSSDIASIRDLSKLEDYAKYENLQDGQKFVKAMELGLIPEGSRFAPGRRITYAPGIPKEERILESERWGFFTAEQVAEMEAAKAKVKASKKEIDAALDKLAPYKVDGGYNLQKAFDEGKGADVNAARELGLFTPEQVAEAQFGGIEAREVARDIATFEAANTKLPDGQWIGNEQLSNLEATAPDIHRALTTSGFDAANKLVVEQQKAIETRVPTETFREQYIRLYGEQPLTIGPFEEQEVSLIDKIISFFTGKGIGKLASGSEFLEASIPGFIAGMSKSQAQTQAETESLYRYLFKEQTGRFPTLGEMPDIKAGLPRGIELASVVPGVVTAYRWDTMSSEQKSHAIQSDIATAALYGMLAIGLTLKPGKVPVVKYKIVNELGVPTGRTIKIPVYAPDTIGTKFAIRNPALWQRGATPIKIYGETGIKPITPILTHEILLRKPQAPVLPSAFKGGVRIPSGLIPPTRIPTTTYFPGSSYITARGIKINIPAGTITSKGLIPSGMEIWSKAGVDQPWSPFAHTGARVLVSPTTGELTIIDVASGRIRTIGLPSTGAEIALGAAPREPSTLTMTPEQVAKLKPLIAPTPYIEYEITPSGLVAPRIIPYPTPKELVVPGVSPMISPIGEPSPAVVPSSVIAPVPSVAPTPTPIVAITPAVTPAPSVEVAPAPIIVPTPVPAVAVPPPLPSAAPLVAPTPPAVVTPAVGIPPVIPWLDQPSAFDKEEKKIEPGTITWRQGIFWIIMPPPYDKRVYSKKPPEGAYKFATGYESAYKTIQVIGGMPTKDIMGIDIGIAIVSIIRKGKELEIQFKQDVEDAYKGKTVKEKITTVRASSRVPRFTREEDGRIKLTEKPKLRRRKPVYTPFFPEDTATPQKAKKREEVGATSGRYYLGHKLPESNVRVEL